MLQKRFSSECKYDLNTDMLNKIAKPGQINLILQRRFAELKIKNPSFSLRAFALKLGLSSGALSEILQGKRKVSKKLTYQVMEKLMLDPEERQKVLAATFADYRNKEIPENQLKLSQDELQILSEWYHYAILNLIDTCDFKNDFSWISARIGLPKSMVIHAIERLKRLHLITEDFAGNFKRKSHPLRTSDDLEDISIKKSHAESMDLAKDSLMKDSVKKRDFTSGTLTINPLKLPQAKELIRQFQSDLAQLMQKGPQTEVYKLNIQLFPLTKEITND